MLRLVAENAACEDALYYLDVGVTDSVISVEVFLKEIRRLARKQFVARATMKKVIVHRTVLAGVLSGKLSPPPSTPPPPLYDIYACSWSTAPSTAERSRRDSAARLFFLSCFFQSGAHYRTL